MSTCMTDDRGTMDGVQGFLSRLDLSEHLEMFMAKGFDSEDDLPYLVEEDLDAMYITDNKARQKILHAAPHYKPSKGYLLYDWLRSKGLDHYFVSFIQSELIDLVDIAKLNLPSEQLYDELEITLPGHKRRLERAVRSLAKKHKTSLPSFVKSSADFGSVEYEENAPVTTLGDELPVAYGRWGKPRCLVDAKYDFLILDATVVSTNDPSDRVHIEFMVDSGSDVVTLRQEVLDTMDLELIGPINSKGVHGSKVKNLYRANVLIGNQSVEIEVMGESYDSIGSRVIRHFRHYISGTRHIWLKGDYIDPTLPHKTNVPEREAVPVTVNQSQETMIGSQIKGPVQVEGLDILTERKQSEISGVPEENIDDTSDQEDFQNEVQIQSDYVKIAKHSGNHITEEANIEISDTKVDFKFAKTETEKVDVFQEDNNESDETDRLRCEEDEIIDIRPIIAANRKRHASNTGGIDPGSDATQINGMVTKKKKVTLQSDSNVLETIDCKKGVSHADNVVADTFRTVLSQRSVYYRSQVKEANKDGS